MDGLQKMAKWYQNGHGKLNWLISLTQWTKKTRRVTQREKQTVYESDVSDGTEDEDESDWDL
jgi:hypothetical protein